MNIANINFKKGEGLVPCIVQDNSTLQILMLGFMNEEALRVTLEDGRVTFYSRSKQRLWTKGETSGHYLTVVSVEQDCDQDTLLIKANPQGSVCHTGNATCFSAENEATGFTFLENIILDRKKNPTSTSYTNQLFNEGINKIAQKVGEEAVELIIEAKDDNKELFVNEAADLMYHYLVLLAAKDIPLSAVEQVLRNRHKKSS